MKVGLTGPSGSGKTTLAKFIEETFSVPFIPGSAGLMFEPEHRKFLETEFGYTNQGHKAVIKMSNENADFGYQFQSGLLRARSRKLKSTEKFVTDRTPLDNLSYFLLQCSHNQEELACREFVKACQEAMASGITHLIIVKPNDSWTEYNGSRVDNNYYQHMTYAVFLGTWQRYFLDRGVSTLILDYWDLDERKANIQSFLSNG